MTESKKNHWAEDEELLEQFVLGRVTSAEAEEFEGHLRVCEGCRTIVQIEKELVSGIRLAGREGIKKRMSERLAGRKTNDAMWYRMVGVAAVIVLLVTIGIYNNWFISNESPMKHTDRADKTETQTAPAQPAASQEAQVRGKEISPGNAARRGGNEGQPNYGARAEGRARQQTAPSVARADAETDKLVHLQGGNVAASGISDEKKDHAVSSRSAAPVETTWIQGAVISEPVDNRPAPAEMAARAMDGGNQLRKGKEENISAGKVAKASSLETKSRSFTITQRQLSELPSSQLSVRQGSSSVQTLLQRNPGATQITVFLDSLVSQKVLDRARVQTIRDDSIVVNLGQKRIGYKLPSDWTGQGMQQFKK